MSEYVKLLDDLFDSAIDAYIGTEGCESKEAIINTYNNSLSEADAYRKLKWFIEAHDDMVSLTKDEFSSLCVCAVRYALGRRTYMPQIISGIVSSRKSKLTKNSLDAIIRDVEDPICGYGDDCDKEIWTMLLNSLKEVKIEEE